MARYRRPVRKGRDIKAMRNVFHDLVVTGDSVAVVPFETEFLYNIASPHKGVLHHFTFNVGTFNLKRAAVLLEVVDPLEGVCVGLRLPLRGGITKGRKSLEINRGSVLRVSVIDKEPPPGGEGGIEDFNFACTLSVRRKDMANGNWANGRTLNTEKELEQ